MHDSGILSFDFMLWHFRSPANTETQALKSSVAALCKPSVHETTNRIILYITLTLVLIKYPFTQYCHTWVHVHHLNASTDINIQILNREGGCAFSQPCTCDISYWFQPFDRLIIFDNLDFVYACLCVILCFFLTVALLDDFHFIYLDFQFYWTLPELSLSLQPLLAVLSSC